MSQKPKPVVVIFPSRQIVANLLGTTPENVANAIRRGGSVCGLPVRDVVCRRCRGAGSVARGFFSKPCPDCRGES